MPAPVPFVVVQPAPPTFMFILNSKSDVFNVRHLKIDLEVNLSREFCVFGPCPTFGGIRLHYELNFL